MSDFLQFVDRIPTLPNRKKLTFENDGSVKYATVEYADEPAEEGTPLSKGGFNRLNAVLGYNELEVQRVHTEEEVPYNVNEIVSETTTTNVTLNANYTSINSTYQKINDIFKPKLNLHTSTNSNIYVSSASSSSTHFSVLTPIYAGGAYAEYYNDLLQRKTKDSNYRIVIKQYANAILYYFDYDFENKSSYTINTNINFATDVTGEIYTSDDGINYTLETTISNSTDFSYNIYNKRYVRLAINFSSHSGEKSASIYYIYFSNITGTYLEENEVNEFTTDTNNSFVNNQRVLVETPNTTDLIGVTKNTLNGIDIPTLLQPSTKYELIYDEDTNKFELGNLTEKQILYDITLTENVNSIDLTGISNKLIVGKLYTLSIQGIGSASDTNIKFGSNRGAYLRQSEFYSLALFTPFYDSNSKKNIAGYYTYNVTTINVMQTRIEDNESISCNNSSHTIQAGTRIIIKEVA